MDAQFINPFIESVFETFETMMQVAPVRSAPYMQDGTQTNSDISGIIGFVEKKIVGSVALCLSNEAAIKAYKLTMGEEVYGLTTDVKDMVGELVNVVAGGAKKKLAMLDYSFHISIPTIVIGAHHSIYNKIDMPVLVVPFTLEGAEFFLKVSMKLTGK